MDDHAFDKKMADKLNNIGDFEYDDAEWEKVNTRLKPISGISLPLAAGLLILALLGSNVWMGYQWRTLREQYNALSTAVDSLTPIANSLPGIVKRDTVYQQVVVHQYDTIHHTVVYNYIPSDKQRQYVSDDQPSLHNREDNSKDAFNKTEGKRSAQVRLPSKTNQQADSLKQVKETIAIDLPSSAAKPPLTDSVNHIDTSAGLSGTTHADSTRKARVYTQKNSQNKSVEADTLVVAAKELEENSKIKIEDREEKKAISLKIGISANLPFLSYPSINSSGGVGVGLRTEVSFFPKLSAFVYGSYAHMKYTASQFNEGLGIADVNNATYQQDILVKVVSQQQILQYGLGLKYTLVKEAKIQPYVALAYFNEFTLGRQLDYSYRDVTNNKVYLINVADVANTSFRHIVEAELGGIYTLSSHTLLQLGGYFSRKIGQENLVRPDQFGLRTVFYYNFNK